MTPTTNLPFERFRRDVSATEAIQWLSSHRHVWYQAPMDYRVTRVYLTSKVQLWKRDATRFSVGVETNGTMADPALRFRIDNSHLDRIRIPNPLWWHGITASVRHFWNVGEYSNVIDYGPLGRLRRAGLNPRQKRIELYQSNGYLLTFDTLAHAVTFAKGKNIRLTVAVGRQVRVLVQERAEHGDSGFTDH